MLADNVDVVVLWYQRAVGHDGRRLDTPVLGLCHVRDGRLARAQMFYFDTAAVGRFPAAGTSRWTGENPIPKRRRWSQADVLNVGDNAGGKPLPATRKAHREARTDDESECRRSSHQVAR